MELRVLRYFLTVAREQNITKAATLLHVTQPTLSRQLQQLEAELGVKLFRRSKYHIVLTDAGVLLRRRAQELVDLAEKTEREFHREKIALSGEITIGAGEAQSLSILSRHIAAFRQTHPQVRFNIYSASADDIKDRLEKGLLDIGLLAEPVEIGRHAFIRLPRKERWGALMRKDHPLAEKNEITPKDLLGVPLLLPWRGRVRSELSGWLRDCYDRIEVAGTYNLILNAANLVYNQVGVAIMFYAGNLSDDLCFVPLSPPLETRSILVWKRDHVFSPAASVFLEEMKYTY